MRRLDPWRGGLALAVLVVLVACGGDDGTEPPVVATVSVSPSSVEMAALGETRQLAVAVLDGSGQPVSGAPVIWASNDNAIATVTDIGLVTAVANGRATVTATSGTASGTSSVTVTQRTARVHVAPSADTLFALDDTLRLSARPLDANDNAIAGVVVAWSSADETVATVDDGGLATATGNGTAEITATAGEAAGVATVTVSQLLVAVDVVPGTKTFFSLGDTARLVATGFDPNGHAIAGISFAWTSEHPAVATVDSQGLVTAVRTGGTDIFAFSGELKDSAGVVVTQLASEVRVTPAVHTLDAVGDTVRLTAVALDRNGHEVEDTDYIWYSPHPAVVTVNDSGLVTARGAGTGEIRVRATRAGADYIGVATITVRGAARGRPPSPGDARRTDRSR